MVYEFDSQNIYFVKLIYRSLRDYIVGNYNQGKASLLNDCTITCTGTNGMLVHLYASSFILKLRSSALAEKLANGSNELDYTNFSASTVRAILKYCYQDDCIKQASSQEVLDLCTFASEYKITSMQKHCVNRLSSIIDRTIALDVWRLSKKYQVDSLKLVVLAFVTKNLKEMLKHNGSEQLAKDISAELGFELLLFQAGTHPLQR